MAGMGERGGTSEEYWEKWNKYKEAVQSKYEINTSFNDDIGEVRELCLSKMTDILPCVMNKASFHIKANGDLYPCCLVGGESIKTQEEYKIGNVFAACNSKMEKHLRLLYERPSKVYTPLCKRLCQYKLFQLNLLGAMAKHTTIAIP